MRLPPETGFAHATKACGGVEELLGKLDSGLHGTASGFPALPAWLVNMNSVDGIVSHF